MNRVTILLGKDETGLRFCWGKVNRVTILLGKGEQGYDFVGER